MLSSNYVTFSLRIGYAGGGWYEDAGSSANTLCLPRDPIWGQYDDGVDESSATIYGAEFHTFQHRDTSFFGEHIYDHDIQCAVCRSTSHTTSVMIPARNVCYDGWTVAYSGYLMAGLHSYKGATEYICMDDNPEPEPDTQQTQDGHLFSFVEGRRGSLACPPYVNGRELTWSNRVLYFG
jgi:hypothetical protein